MVASLVIEGVREVSSVVVCYNPTGQRMSQQNCNGPKNVSTFDAVSSLTSIHFFEYEERGVLLHFKILTLLNDQKKQYMKLAPGSQIED